MPPRKSFRTVKYQFRINNAKVLENAKIVFVPPTELRYLCLCHKELCLNNICLNKESNT